MWSFLEFAGAQQNILRFKIGMRVSISVHESNSLEELSCEWLNDDEGEAIMVIAFDDIVEGGS